MKNKILVCFSLCVGLLSSGWGATQMGPMEVGGQFRTRYEVADPNSFTANTSQRTQDLLLFRTRVWGRATMEEQNLRVFVQIQDSRVSGSEASVAANSANVDLHQGYLDILSLWGQKMNLRVGRQELKYGDQRLISTLEWSNVGRSWDGARLESFVGPFQADLFYTIVNEVNDFYQDQKFSGLYLMLKDIPQHEFDGYILSRHSGNADDSVGNGASDNLKQWTIGTRAKGKTGSVDYSGEIAQQVGKSLNRDIDALAFALTGGVTLASHMEPRIGAAYDYASGDENPTDNDVETFDPLFPFGHSYQGHADVFSWKNGSDLQAHFSFKPSQKTKVMAAYHHFRLAEERDAWYNAGGTAIAQDTTGAAGKDVGNEIDIHVKTTFREVVNLWFGYAHFFAGDFVKRTVGNKDKEFAFFQASINF